MTRGAPWAPAPIPIATDYEDTMKRITIALPLALFAGTVLAHPGHESASFLSGFGHPLGGLDHLLAMITVGLFAARQAAAARWALPLVFVAAMLIGAATSAVGLHVPAMEAGIAASVLVLGLLVAFVARLPLALAGPMVALFALFHGHAHHAEMGAGSALAFTVGFVLASASLHAAGYVLARWLPDTSAARSVRRALGGLVATVGAVLLVA